MLKQTKLPSLVNLDGDLVSIDLYINVWKKCGREINCEAFVSAFFEKASLDLVTAFRGQPFYLIKRQVFDATAKYFSNDTN